MEFLDLNLLGEGSYVEWSDRWEKGCVAGCIIGGGPTVCEVEKRGWEEVFRRAVVLRCGSGVSGRMSAGGAEGTGEEATGAWGGSCRSCV